MDEQTSALFAYLGNTIASLAELQIIEMLASDKYTVPVKAWLVEKLMSIYGGHLPMDLSYITGKDETEFLEMMANNNGGNGGNGGGSGPENPATPK